MNRDDCSHCNRQVNRCDSSPLSRQYDGYSPPSQATRSQKPPSPFGISPSFPKFLLSKRKINDGCTSISLFSCNQYYIAGKRFNQLNRRKNSFLLTLSSFSLCFLRCSTFSTWKTAFCEPVFPFFTLFSLFPNGNSIIMKSNSLSNHRKEGAALPVRRCECI